MFSQQFTFGNIRMFEIVAAAATAAEAAAATRAAVTVAMVVATVFACHA